MKKYALTLLSLAFSLMANAQQGKMLTAKDYEKAEKMMSYNTEKFIDGGVVRPQWLTNDQFKYSITAQNEKKTYLVDPIKKTKSLIANDENEAPMGMPMGRRGGRGEVVSPDGKKSVFIKDWNLWLRNLETKVETQLTKDGIKDFGYATDNAGWKNSDGAIVKWSPDSKKLTTFQQDQRHLSDMYLVSTNVGNPTLRAWKYPLPGDKEVAKLHRVVIDVEQAKVIRLQIPADDHRSSLSDDIVENGQLADIDWNTNGNEFAFLSTSRDHKISKMRIANALTGEVREVFEEVVKTHFESGRGSINWRYLPQTNEILWYSQRDNWGHMYLYDATTGKLKNQITKGDWLVGRLLKVDEKSRTLYFMGHGKEAGNPYFAYFYKIGFDGKGLTLLTPDLGNHSITFSPTGKYFIDTYSQPNVPAVTAYRNIAGKLVLNLEQVDVSRLAATGWKAPTPVSVKAHDGVTDIYGLVFTPTNMDPNKKYPVVDYIYPGPQGGSVGSWSFNASRGDHQALAELGFIVVMIEGTSNPFRSKSYHDMSYGNMAENTLPDQIAAIKELAKTYPIDLDRVGMWGHSGGGFATAAAMFRYPDFFKVGIAESGNHDNRNYEDDWGERYNGLAENVDYAAQANQTYAKNLKGKLLLAHGMMDNNVPPSNTMLVVDALIKANKDFDLLLFPNSAHSFGPFGPYMMRKRWDYFVKHLLNAEPPKEYNLRGTTVTERN